ncbi:MAG TPA: hypothetical protein DDW23_04660 [Planctomycetes bacterium]|nr:hypothetical protein [Planctomycetota bacterium]
MDDRRLKTVIREVRRMHGRKYAEAAYFFVLEALDYTLFLLGKTKAQGDERHVDGGALMEGVRKYAQEEFGPLALYAFHSWGIQETDDFGDIVFQMCDIGLLNKRPSDCMEDFHAIFDFSEVFAGVDEGLSGA